MPLGVWIFASNVDGQFQKAGFSEAQIPECHGSVHHLQCINQCTSTVRKADGFEPEVDDESCCLLNQLPLFSHCGGLARPNVLMFNEWNWVELRAQSQARLESNRHGLQRLQKIRHACWWYS